MGLILDIDFVMHLPQPRVLHREGNDLAAAVAMPGHGHVTIAVLVAGAGEQQRCARLDLADRVDDGQRRQGQPAIDRFFAAVGELQRRVHPGGGGRLDPDVAAEFGPRLRRHDHGRYPLQYGVTVAALGERVAAAEQQQAAAAFADEIDDHLLLFETQQGGFDTAEYQCVVGEKLGAGGRETVA